MPLIYFILGLITGKNFTLKERKRTEDSPGNKKQKTSTARIRKTYRTYINGDPEKIKPENIKFKINTPDTTTDKPNFIVLAVLWAHFQALESGRLRPDSSAPWYQYKEEMMVEQKEKQQKWRKFLQNIITDKSWVQWIKNPAEVRSRSLEAYRNI